MSTASQATSSKATLRRFHDAMNTGDAETISKTIDQTEGGNPMSDLQAMLTASRSRRCAASSPTRG
jgi:hypothetical protein